MRLWMVLAGLGLAMVAPQASAQRYWAENQIPYCQPYSDIAACQDASLALLVEKHRVPAAEQLAEEGYQGLRLFRYDAFGTLWPMVSFVTRPLTEYRNEGTLEARMVHADGQLTTLSVPAWEGGWLELDNLVTQVKARHSPPEPERARRGEPPAIPPSLTCLDPPTTVVEVINQGRVERWWPAPCGQDDAAAMSAAFEVWDMAGAAFPHCAYVPLAGFGRSLGRVRACLLVQGQDPLSALDVMDVLRPNIGGDTRVAYEGDRLADDVRLTTQAGEVFVGRAAVLAALKANALGNRWLQVLRAEGERGIVTVRGQLNLVNSRSPDSVPFSQTWDKSPAGEWVIVDWAVQPGESPSTLAE